MGQRYSERLNITVEYDLKKTPLSSTEKSVVQIVSRYFVLLGILAAFGRVFIHIRFLCSAELGSNCTYVYTKCMH